MAILNAAIASIDTTLLIVPAGKRYAVTTIMVCNTADFNPLHEEAEETNFDMHFVKNGSPKAIANKVVNTQILPAGETFTFDSERIILEEGDRVILLGESPTNLVATISYMEV
jgi:hypothetical protein